MESWRREHSGLQHIPNHSEFIEILSQAKGPDENLMYLYASKDLML